MKMSLVGNHNDGDITQGRAGLLSKIGTDVVPTSMILAPRGRGHAVDLVLLYNLTTYLLLFLPFSRFGK